MTLICVLGCSTKQSNEQTDESYSNVQYYYTTTTINTSVLITKNSEDDSNIAESIEINPEEIVLKIGEAIQLQTKIFDKN